MERVFFLSAKRDLLLGFCSKFWSTWGKLLKLLVILVVNFQVESAPLEMTTLSQSLSLFSLFHPRLVIIANINVFVSSFVRVCARYPMIMIKRCCCCCVHFDIDTASPSAQVYRTRSLAGWLVGLFEWILACQTGVRAPTLPTETVTSNYGSNARTEQLQMLTTGFCVELVVVVGWWACQLDLL